MTMRLHEKIRHHLESTPGLTQRGLAERMGVNPAAVNRMLYGRRNIMADELPVIEDYLGVALDIGRMAQSAEYQQNARGAARGFSDIRRMEFDGREASAQQFPPPVAVYRDYRSGEVIDWAVRHPHQFALREAYALYVDSEDMQPRYFRGELIYVHPAKPVMTGSDCVVEYADGRVALRRLVQKSSDKIVVQLFNPARLEEVPAKDVSALHSIVGRG